ncbi:MAG: hypothetical protein V3V25_12340 [Paracoccaceae bacterium]
MERRIFLNTALGTVAASLMGLSPGRASANAFPIRNIGPIRGVNLQAVFRSKLHRGNGAEQQVLDTVSNAVTKLGFNSIRIGGTSSFGASFDPAYKGFGWHRNLSHPMVRTVHGNNDPYRKEPFNFNIMAVKVAAQTGCSVWLTFNSLSTEGEIDRALNTLVRHNVPLAGVSRDNEPYIPVRFADVDSAYQRLASPLFRDATWPAMFIAPNGQPKGRAARQDHTAKLVNHYRKTGTPIELHIYYPDTKGVPSPKAYISQSLENSSARFQTTKFMIGEWSIKKQEKSSGAKMREVVGAYLDHFEANSLPSYYQLLGSEFDQFGLWNFKTNRPNISRGADIFAKRWGHSSL